MKLSDLLHQIRRESMADFGGRGSMLMRASFRERVRQEAAMFIGQHGEAAIPLLLAEIVNELSRRVYMRTRGESNRKAYRNAVIQRCLLLVEQIRSLDTDIEKLDGQEKSS